MRAISGNEISEISGGLSLGKLIASVTVGAITGAVRGIPGGPVGMVGNAIFGAGMAAAGVAVHNAAAIAEQNANNQLQPNQN